MRGKKPYATIEEHIKSHRITIDIFRRRGAFSYALNTLIGDGGVGFGPAEEHGSFYAAKNAALRQVAECHQSPPQRELLKRFRIMRDMDQPLLFYD